jgi:hypothetical protein
MIGLDLKIYMYIDIKEVYSILLLHSIQMNKKFGLQLER